MIVKISKGEQDVSVLAEKRDCCGDFRHSEDECSSTELLSTRNCVLLGRKICSGDKYWVLSKYEEVTTKLKCSPENGESRKI